MESAETSSHAIETIFLEERRYPPPPEFSASANAQADIYERDWLELWAGEARERVTWFEPFGEVLEWERPYAKWFLGGKLNVTYNCVDRHVEAGRGDKVAYYWEGEPEGDRREVTFAELQRETTKLANALKSLGVKKGTPVGIYMGMVPEHPVAMLACARIGAPHSVVFGGFSAEALKDRINDAEAKVLITGDGAYRRGQVVPLKQNCEEALKDTPTIEHVVTVRRTGAHRHPGVHAVGTGVSGQTRPVVAPAARLRGRAHQSRGLGVVLEVHRRRALPGRRHVVADGDGVHPDHAGAGHHEAEAGERHPSIPRRRSRRLRRTGTNGRARWGRVPRTQATLALDVPDDLGRSRPVRADVLREVRHRHLPRRRRVQAGRRGLLLAAREDRRRDERGGPPHLDVRGGERAGRRPEGGRGGRGGEVGSAGGAGHHGVRDAERLGTAGRRRRGRAPRARGAGEREDSSASAHYPHRRPAQDAQR